MLSLVAELREELARKRPRITPPTTETVDALRSLAGPLGNRPDPLVEGYAATRIKPLARTFPQAARESAVRFTPPDAETQRLMEIDVGAPHGEPPFPGYERGAQYARGAGERVGGLVGQEDIGGGIGEFAYRGGGP